MRIPRRLTLESLWTASKADLNNKSRVFYNRDGLALLQSGNIVKLMQQMQVSAPFLVEDYRCGWVKSGSIRTVVNLREWEMSAGMIAFITPGTIVEPLGYSADFQLEGMGLSADLFRLLHGNRLPELFNGQMKDGRLLADEADLTIIRQLFRILWEIAHADRPDRAVLAGVVSSITAYYNVLFSALSPAGKTRSTSAHDIFDRFILLVNAHCRSQRSLDFYAGELCITERYLGTLVHQVSGITAKEWIDRAVLSLIKVMLCHSSRQVSQIADELNFPNASFFCKYFKRLSGMTPREYREEMLG